MEDAYISIIKTEYGVWKIEANGRAVTGIYLVSEDSEVNENAVSADAAKQLREYLVNIRTTFDIPVEARGTPFQMDVWRELRRVPYGQTVTYGELASRIERPKAVRAVGQAVGRNPCLVVIPCHRVLGKDGSLTGFSAGMDLKKQLLHLEKIPFLE